MVNLNLQRKTISDKEIVLNELNNENNWFDLVRNYNLSEDIIEEYYDKIKLPDLCIHQKLTFNFIDRHIDEFDFTCWNAIATYQELTEKFIDKYKDKINWSSVCIHQTLSEDFIIQHKEYVNWNYVSKYQKLSEKFMQDNIHNLDIYTIGRFQNISVQFILDNADKFRTLNMINLSKICTCQNFSKDDIKLIYKTLIKC
jgi:hypothetical protein